MAKDAFGQTIAIGDSIVVRAKVVEIEDRGDYALIQVESDLPCYPGGEHKTNFTVNGTQLEVQQKTLEDLAGGGE